jgi:hypothetical protein
MHPISGGGAPIAGRSPVELPPWTAASGGRSVPADDLTVEVAVLAALLVEVVELAADSAVFPSRLQVVAELALEHDSVRRALAAEGTAS